MSKEKTGIEIAKVMVQPTIKFLELCNNAFGTVYEPRHMKKMADAEAYKITKISEAIANSNYLPITYTNGDISMSSENFADFAMRAEFRSKYQSLREQSNIDNIVTNAYQELHDAPEVPNDPVDADWTARFFNIAKEINTEEMQLIWGKILAGEVKKTGSFSMRTLETIRNLSKNEAETFLKIAPFIVAKNDDYLLSDNKELLNQYGIKFSDILLLNECGLVSTSAGLSMTVKFNERDGNGLIFYNDALVATCVSSENERKIQYSLYTLTSAGKELYRILTFTPNRKYFTSFVEHISKNNNGLILRIHNVVAINDPVIHYSNEILHEFGQREGND